MESFREKVVVVTGAASGIGRALARAFAAEGAYLVLADIERPPLAAIARELADAGAAVLEVPTDVSCAEAVEDLAARCVERWGGADVLCNNAGVSLIGRTWEHSPKDWEWVLGVNLFGVVNGIRAFVPRMLDRGAPAHIVNTASMAGFLSQPRMSVYNASKHAVVAISETLFHEFRQEGAPIDVSVLCPGFVNTNIIDSARNRPQTVGGGASVEPAVSPEDQARRAATRAELAGAGLSPERVAEMVLTAIRERRFYVFPHPHRKDGFRVRAREILDEVSPTYSILTA